MDVNVYETALADARQKRIQSSRLICPYCGGETVREDTEEICSTCGTTMKERKLCECCGEYSIPEDSCADFCESCKKNAKDKLYNFLKENFSEKQIDVLDEVVDDTLYWFIKDYEEEQNG